MGFLLSITDRFPITNIPDLLGLYHNNPLGLTHEAQLLIIFLLVEVMAVFNFFIRKRDKAQFYPIVYVLLALSLLAVFYYCFQTKLPEITLNMRDHSIHKPCIGWFCQHEIVGWGWAIVGIAALTHVTYSLLCAVLQVSAQLYVEANYAEGKKWKEWKGILYALVFGIAVVGISSRSNYIFSSWVLCIVLALLILGVIIKIILDTKRMKKPLIALLIGVLFFIGVIATIMLILDCFRGLLFFVIIFLVVFISAKASKKKPANKL